MENSLEQEGSNALSAIITLSRMAEAHLAGYDEEFRYYYFQQTHSDQSVGFRTKMNIDFITNWQARVVPHIDMQLLYSNAKKNSN